MNGVEREITEFGIAELDFLFRSGIRGEIIN